MRNNHVPRIVRPNIRILFVQLVILAICALAVVLLVINFPFPSPLVKPFLPPKVRWPTAQIESWVEQGKFGGDYLAFFARDPDRTIPSGANLVSPSDGVVKNFEFHDGITYLVVGLSFWDVHVVRTPVAGMVKDVEVEGTYLQRDVAENQLEQTIFLRGKVAPVQQIVTLETNLGELKVRLITSYWASRLKVWVHPGEHLDKGQRIGRILLGSTVVAELPGQFSLSVRKGERVVGGETIILQGDGKE